MIKELEAKLGVFHRETEEEEQTVIFDVNMERVDNESNEARGMELKVPMLEAETARARQIWRENTLKAKLAEAEERERRAEI